MIIIARAKQQTGLNFFYGFLKVSSKLNVLSVYKKAMWWFHYIAWRYHYAFSSCASDRPQFPSKSKYWKRCVCACITLVQLSDVSGSYVMEVSVHSYRNPTGRCDECQPGPDPGCCDETSVRPANEECPENSTCDPFLAYCTRPIGGICSTDDILLSNMFFLNTNNVNFDLAGSLFGLDNPLVVERNEPWSVSNWGEPEWVPH